MNCEVNLPGTEDTVINQAVPPGGDSGIALCRVEACDLPKRGRLGCAIFGRGGLRSRIPCTLNSNRTCNVLLIYQAYLSSNQCLKCVHKFLVLFAESAVFTSA